MRNLSFVLFASLSLIACGDDSPSPDAAGPSIDAAVTIDGAETIDAAETIDGAETVDSTTQVDAAALAVTVVDCGDVTAAVTVITASSQWTPNDPEIAVGDVVAFEPENIHAVVSDDGLWSGSVGEAVCVQFDAPGAYDWHCGPHPSMIGTVTVSVR
jgi:plastocyanin